MSKAQLSFSMNGYGVAYDQRKTKRVVKNGHATTELVLSASLDGNDKIFPKILQLYVRPGSVVADITYGKGVFWRNVGTGAYKLRATDIQDGVDCRAADVEAIDDADDGGDAGAGAEPVGVPA